MHPVFNPVAALLAKRLDGLPLRGTNSRRQSFTSRQPQREAELDCAGSAAEWRLVPVIITGGHGREVVGAGQFLAEMGLRGVHLRELAQGEQVRPVSNVARPATPSRLATVHRAQHLQCKHLKQVEHLIDGRKGRGAA